MTDLTLLALAARAGLVLLTETGGPTPGATVIHPDNLQELRRSDPGPGTTVVAQGATGLDAEETLEQVLRRIALARGARPRPLDMAGIV